MGFIMLKQAVYYQLTEIHFQVTVFYCQAALQRVNPKNIVFE